MAWTERLSGRPPAAASQRVEFAGARTAIWKIWLTETVADQGFTASVENDKGLLVVAVMRTEFGRAKIGKPSSELKPRWRLAM